MKQKSNLNCKIFFQVLYGISFCVPWLVCYSKTELPSSCLDDSICSAEHTVISKFAYIIQDMQQTAGSSAIQKCNIDAKTGLLSACIDSGYDNFGYPYGFAIQRFGTQNFAYVVSQSNPAMIYQCLINPSSGLFDECSDAGVSFAYPVNITFYKPQNGELYAYVAAGTSPTVFQCTVDITTGTLLVCTDLEIPLVVIDQVAFNAVGNQLYSYITENTFFPIYKYTVNADGAFFNPVVQNTNESYGAIAISFIEFAGQTYAYIAQSRGLGASPIGPNLIARCAVDSTTGDLFTPSCLNASAFEGFNNPYSIAFLTLKNRIYAYISNFGISAPGLGNVTQCYLDFATMNLVDCRDSGAGSLTNPTNVAFF